MRILHINSYYDNDGKPGFYKNLYDIQKDDMPITVFVPTHITYDSKNRDFGDYTRIVKSYNKIDRFFFLYKEEKIFDKMCENIDISLYDIVHAHSLFSNGYLAYRIKKKFDVPYVVAVRDTDINIFFEKFFYLRKFGIEILKESSNVIFLSQAYRDKLLEKFIPEFLVKEISQKSLVIPNGINEFWLNNKYYNKKFTDKKTIRIIYVGNVEARKNVQSTIGACRLLQERGYTIDFKIVGKIKEKKFIELINKYSFVQYKKFCEKEELISFYRESDIFVMPSKTETFGLVYAEAMSQGVPVIYTRGQGFDQQFKDGDIGYAVDCRSVKDIADKIEMIKKDIISISQRCIEKVDKFQWKKISKEYSNIYSRLYRSK